MSNERKAANTRRTRFVPILLSQVFGLTCGVLGVKLTTRLVQPADYGLFGVFVSFAPVGMWFLHAGLIKFVGRHWAVTPDRSGLLRASCRAMARKLPWLMLATGIGAFAFSRDQWLQTWSMLLAVAALLSWTAMAQAALQAAQYHWHDFAVVLTGSASRSFVPPLVYAAAGGSVVALYAGFTLHAVAFSLAAAIALQGYLRRPATGSVAVTPIYEGSLFVALAFAGWVLAGLPRWLMTFFYGATAGGYFALAANLAAIVPSILGTIALQYYQPIFFRTGESAADRQALAAKVDRVALAHAGIAVGGLITLKFIAPLLMGALIDERYRAAMAMLVPAGCATLALATGWFYHTLLLATKREHACGRVELVSAFVLVAGSLAAALAGEHWLLRWMTLSPLIPWLVTRPLARRAVLNTDEDSARAPAP